MAGGRAGDRLSGQAVKVVVAAGGGLCAFDDLVAVAGGGQLVVVGVKRGTQTSGLGYIQGAEAVERIVAVGVGDAVRVGLKGVWAIFIHVHFHGPK